MIRAAVSVEGQTEEEFVNTILAPPLYDRGVYLVPKVVVTKVNAAGPNHKGGDITISRIVREVTPLLSSFDFVTTLYDLYGFRDRVANESADDLNARIANEVGASPQVFIPYVQQYELEGLIFSAPDIVGEFVGDRAITVAMFEDLAGCGSPENVNDGRSTAPSKRLTNYFEGRSKGAYRKTRHGVQLLSKIGLEKVREECPRFNSWVTNLEVLGS